MVQPGDILLTKGGSIARVGITTYKAAASRDLIFINSSLLAEQDQHFLYLYFQSGFFNRLLIRSSSQTAQPHLTITLVRDLPILSASDTFKAHLSKFVKRAFLAHNTSLAHAASAESKLVDTLGLGTWTPPEALSYVRSNSEAFAAKRLDAEHFKPRIAALLELLNATGQAQPLSEVMAFNQRGQQPTYCENGLPVINSKHVNRGEVRLDDDNRVATFDEKTPLIQPGDVLMNGTGVGTIGRSAPYLHQTPAIPDNHVTILRPKPGIDPVYLSVFLNSIAGQIQVEQWQRGSSGQIELYPDDIARFLVWVAPTSTQRSVKQAIESSFQEKQRSTMLLDAACRAVEIAIENSEAAAMDYLETQG